MRTLLSTVSMQVSAFQAERLALIDAEDFGTVVKKTRDDLCKQGRSFSAQELEEGVLALKQYYAVALLDPTNQHAVSDAIDPFWHAHILHTKQYAAFCSRVFGEFVHHDPLDHSDLLKVRHVAKLYQYTSELYRGMFSYVNASFYPAVLRDEYLVCLHYEIANDELRSHSRFKTHAFAA